MSSLNIDLYSDVVCPWCFIGAERLERVLATFDEAVELTYHPFLLQPNAPAEGIDVQEMLRKKYGAEPRRMFDTVESAARETGLFLDLTRQPYSYPTERAHTLLRHAQARGTQRALALDLFRAHFIEAHNVSDVETLTNLAGRHGFTAPEVSRIVQDEEELSHTRIEAERAARRGIRGVPFFVLGGRTALSGAQKEEVLRSAIEQGLSPRR